ncbi:hypothetical protein BLNAU_18093 [Blattamonas nauphoetae]|uniref:Uncharacterized protein n=1 Tax=Blattamonas nauphoetae TaxID=2049346 RepID=A0ABQ9X8L0_9EUKA|nr:hypothetical protein BLNAU_18093 [Blattamonas nauphoetae]
MRTRSMTKDDPVSNGITDNGDVFSSRLFPSPRLPRPNSPEHALCHHHKRHRLTLRQLLRKRHQILDRFLPARVVQRSHLLRHPFQRLRIKILTPPQDRLLCNRQRNPLHHNAEVLFVTNHFRRPRKDLHLRPFRVLLLRLSPPLLPCMMSVSSFPPALAASPSSRRPPTRPAAPQVASNCMNCDGTECGSSQSSRKTLRSAMLCQSDCEGVSEQDSNCDCSSAQHNHGLCPNHGDGQRLGRRVELAQDD